MLRNSMKNIIYNALNFDIFRFEDFEFDESKAFALLSISYDEFYLNISGNSNALEITYSPGSVLNQESEAISLTSFEKKIETIIHNWLLRIKRDLLTPMQTRFVIDQIDKFRDEVNEKLKDMDDTYFSAEEGKQLKEKLDELEVSFVQASQENNEIKEELEQLKSEISFLRETINTLSKKRWYVHALIKLFAWGQKKENQLLIKSGFEAVKAITQIDIPDVK